MNHSKIPDVHKIAILRTNQGLGDLLVCLPAVNMLQEAYPSAEIVLLGLPWHEPFLRHRNTGIGRVIPVPATLQLANLNKDIDRNEASFFEEMREEGFDIVLNFQSEEELSCHILKHLAARCTVGQAMTARQVYDRSLPFSYYQHEVLRHLHLVELIGGTQLTLQPVLKLLPSEQEEAARILSQSGIKSPFIVLHPGATDMRRRWPAAKFAELADALIAAHFTIVLAGDERDSATIHDVKDHMKGEAHLLYKSLSLGMLAAIQASSLLVISNDTGPLHLARAVGCPTVGLYWAPNLVNWGPLYQDRHMQLISWELPCPHCGVIPTNPYPFEPKTHECEHLYSFVAPIAVSDVVAAARSLVFISHLQDGGVYA